MLARRTVAIVDADLRRVAVPAGDVLARSAHRRVARGGDAAGAAADRARRQRGGGRPARRGARAGGCRRRPRRGRAASWASTTRGTRRPDRHLPAIAALIDPRQFELITQPTSGLIAIQGSAGSGKTTIGLHRIAYLAFADPRRFRPEKMLVIVYQRALATYVSRVLPSLDVDGVPVMTFAGWAGRRAPRGAARRWRRRLTDETPPLVMRAKAHGAMLRIIDDRQAALADWCRDAAGSRSSRARPTRRPCWRSGTAPAAPSTGASPRWRSGCATATLDPATRNALENTGRTLRARTRDVVGEWAALLTDREALGDGLRAPRARAVLARPARRHPPLVRRARSPAHGGARSSDDDETFALDAEDDALLLRIYQRQRGRLPGRDGSKGVARLRAPDGRRGAGLLAARAGGAARRDDRAAFGDAGGRHRAGDRARARLLRTGPSCWTSSASRTSASSRCASATARRARSSTSPSTCWGR